jgi:hypothetical protein
MPVEAIWDAGRALAKSAAFEAIEFVFGSLCAKSSDMVQIEQFGPGESWEGGGGRSMELVIGPNKTLQALLVCILGMGGR